MDKEEYNYYKSEVDRLSKEPFGGFYTIVIVDGKGNSTNWMNITPEQLAKIREILAERE